VEGAWIPKARNESDLCWRFGGLGAYGVVGVWCFCLWRAVYHGVRVQAEVLLCVTNNIIGPSPATGQSGVGRAGWAGLGGVGMAVWSG
jgi:hypothetical protein